MVLKFKFLLIFNISAKTIDCRRTIDYRKTIDYKRTIDYKKTTDYRKDKNVDWSDRFLLYSANGITREDQSKVYSL